MDLSGIDTDIKCRHCSLQTVNYIYADADKHMLFHEPCRECDDGDGANLGSPVTLCDRCRHLRLPHLMLCCLEKLPEDEQGIYVRFDLSMTFPEKCALCHFITSCVPPDEEVEIRISHSSGTCFLETRDSSISLFAERSGQCTRRVTEYIDWAWLRRTMKETSETNNSVNTSFTILQDLQDVCVIDVSDACLVQLPHGAPYAALSYVWGTGSVQLQALVSNIQALKQPGSLEDADLPRTILDTLKACKDLDVRYLWVDRLCILQDDSWEKKSIQLNQMAAIYTKAVLTLVALAGDGADYGLPGVSRARTVKQRALRLNDSVGLIYGTQNLQSCLTGSKWYSRGWTYQEHMASSALLLFTDDGLHFQQGYDYKRETYSEGPTHNIPASRNNDVSSLAMIEVYTRRTLTYSTDILRALAGILFAVYGQRISFGMPWDHFDRAMLWKPYGYQYKQYKYKQRESAPSHIFPSWSWISVEGLMVFDHRGNHVFRLAYWGRPVSDTENSSIFAERMPIEVPMQSRNDANYSGPFKDDFEIGKLGALAWLNGCIPTKVPDWLRVDCSNDEYTERVNKKWPDRESSFWRDASHGYARENVFKDIHLKLRNVVGRLPVHAQIASLTLDWKYADNQNERFDPGCTSVLIRTNEHRIAGSVQLDEEWAQKLKLKNQGQTEFIAISTSRDWYSHVGNSLIYSHIPKSSESISPSTFYGCPCSIENKADLSTTHIAECPKHVDFFSPIECQPRRLERKDRNPDETHMLALSKHLADLSYLDTDGHLLHDMIDVPRLNVLLISPSQKGCQERGVYKRIGIGSIYLKRWVEASPVFETIVLE